MTSIDQSISATPRKRRRLFKTKQLYPIVSVVIILGLWEFLVTLFGIGQWLLPRPSQVLIACVYQAPALLAASGVTMQEIVLGFVMSVAFGILVAMAIVSSKTIEEGAYPLLVGTQVIPKIAIAPILTTWFGFGMAPKVMMVFLISFFPIVIDSIVGLESVALGKVQLAQTMGASRLQIFAKIRLPNALPNILGGMKVASTLAVVGALVGEFISSDAGLGRIMLIANGDFNTPLLFAAITYVTLIGVILFGLVGLIERLAIPWHVSKRGDFGGH